MFADMMQLNYILFQLVKLDTFTNDAKEMLVVSLAVFPSNITYQYGSRASINQTLGENEVNGFKESYGRALTKLIIRGVFGKRSRMTGSQWKNGWTRLIEFRELVFKLSNIQQGQTKRKIPGVNTQVKNSTLNKDDVYVVNFYDFYNNEKFAINLDQFQIIEDVSHNNLPNYVLVATELGDIAETTTNDPVMSILIKAEEYLNQAVEKANQLLNNIKFNDVVKGIAGAQAFFDVVVTSLGHGLQGANNLLNITSEMSNILKGSTHKAYSLTKQGGFKSIF